LGDRGTGAGCSGKARLKPLPRVIIRIGILGNKKAIINPAKKYIIELVNDIQSQSI
jgi:hypothetical protein